MTTIRATLCALFRCLVLLALYLNGLIPLWIYLVGIVIGFAIEVLDLKNEEWQKIISSAERE